MKSLTRHGFSLSLLLIIAFAFVVGLPLVASGSTESPEEHRHPGVWESAVVAVETNILKSMHDLTAKKKWDAAKAHLVVYRDIGSCPSAAEAIGKMLITKNKDGALAIIQLTMSELISPHQGPITSTRQVKRSFIRAVQSSKKEEAKSELLVTFFNVFSLDGLVPSEKVALHELQRMVGEGLLKTATTIENILLAIIEEVGNLSPLDDRGATPTPSQLKSSEGSEEIEESEKTGS